MASAGKEKGKGDTGGRVKRDGKSNVAHFAPRGENSLSVWPAVTDLGKGPVEFLLPSPSHISKKKAKKHRA